MMVILRCLRGFHFHQMSHLMVRKLNRPFLSFLTMNSVKEEPHMVRAVAE